LNSPGVDELTSVGSTNYVYNDDGELTQRGSDTLSWDGWGRLSGGNFSGGSIGYGFDAAGNRRQRVTIGKTTRYLYAGGSNLFETDGSGAITQTYVEGAGYDLAHYAGPPTTGSPVSFLYYSGHGDLAAEADTNGTRTNAYTYDPFGVPNESVPANSTTERWLGRWDKKLDTLSSLIEMGVRPYDPSLGRFLSVDPVDGGSLNLYDYADQDSINAYDLSGKMVAGTPPHCSRFRGKALKRCAWLAWTADVYCSRYKDSICRPHHRNWGILAPIVSKVYDIGCAAAGAKGIIKAIAGKAAHRNIGFFVACQILKHLRGDAERR
jgi:RHS repeat-associated protein